MEIRSVSLVKQLIPLHLIVMGMMLPNSVMICLPLWKTFKLVSHLMLLMMEPLPLSSGDLSVSRMFDNATKVISSPFTLNVTMKIISVRSITDTKKIRTVVEESLFLIQFWSFLAIKHVILAIMYQLVIQVVPLVLVELKVSLDIISFIGKIGQQRWILIPIVKKIMAIMRNPFEGLMVNVLGISMTHILNPGRVLRQVEIQFLNLLLSW
mmetsp:Transcript_39408/g.54926  ORF Transcript_39408/g.54926 Transcript_39408/m.54926 type:complete len:210 (+) Transcript_39408:436-1065(+)